MSRRISSLTGLLAALVLAGCGNSRNQPIQEHVALQSFASCGELEKYIEDTAVEEMRSQLEQSKENWGWYRGGPVFFDDAGGPVAGPTTDAGGRGPTAYTTTNTQVGGVDEADFVKNDGTRIFVLSGNKLYASQSWPADQLQTVGRLQIEGWPQEMYLDGNTVVVFSSVWTEVPFASASAPVCLDTMSCGYYYSNTLKVTVVDVTNMAAMAVAGEIYLPGYYRSSRKVGTSVRLVSNDYFRWPQDVKWWPEYQAGLWDDKALWAQAIDALIAQNEKVIRAQSLWAWLPQATYVGPDHVAHQVGYDCKQFAKTNAPTRLGLATVATLNLDPNDMAAHNGPSIHRISLVGEATEIYASASSLYLAENHWWWWPEPGQTDYTYLHKFDITDPSAARYVGSGGVEGSIIDQFSMDEYQGFLRVATTVMTRVPDPANPESTWGTFELNNRVSVLGQDGKELKVVGRSEDIAKGERLYSSRFMGPKGFVVTFRQTDPLFTFDLSNPASPTRVGELVIPGFSTYLHPLDDDHLLAIGETRDSSGSWGSRALKLSIFDVTDFAHPVEAFTQVVGTANGYSEALWDHKAFNYFPERGLLAIPFWDYNPNASTGADYWSWFVSDLRVFQVSATTGFVPKGSLAMNDVFQSFNYSDPSGARWTYYWTPTIRRSVMADNFVYAISDAGIRVADVDSLPAPLATTLFDTYQSIP